MARYFLNIGTDTNSTANWSNTSGGAGGFSVPTSTDDVFFDANSGPATLTANMSVKTLTFTGYTSTITMSFNITASGSVTLDTTMTVAGAGTLFVNATATLTSNGKTWGNPMSFTNTITITLVGDLYVAGTVTTTTQTFNGSAIYCTTSLSVTGSMVAGTSNFHLNGTGTWSGAGTLRNNLLIDSTANLTISGSVYYGTGTLTVDPAATVVTTGSTLSVATSATFYTGSMVWNNIIFSSGSTTTTLLSDLYVGGTFLLSGSRTFNGFTIYSRGNFIINALNFGTTTFVRDGAGTWSGSSTFSRNLTITGTTTLAGTVSFGGNTLTASAGIIISSGAILNITTTSTLDTGANVLESVITGASGATTTLNSLLLCNNLSIVGTGFHTFSGSFGFTVGSLLCQTAGRTIILKAGLTYTVNANSTVNGSSGSLINLKSSIPSSYAYFTLAYGASQNMRYIQATDIDSSGGQTIMAGVNSILLRTINWQLTEGNWWLVLNRA